MTDKRETPETDAAAGPLVLGDDVMVMIEFARSLERRLIAAEAEMGQLTGSACLICGLPNDSTCPQRADEMSPCTFDPSPIDAAKAFLRRAEKAEAELAASRALLRECAPIVLAAAEAEHLTDGFGPIVKAGGEPTMRRVRRPLDDLADRLRALDHD